MVTKPVAVIGATFTWNSNAIGRMKVIGTASVENQFAEDTFHDATDGLPESTPTDRKIKKHFELEGSFDLSDAGIAAFVTDAETFPTPRRAFTYAASDGSWEQTGYGYAKSYEITGEKTSDTYGVKITIQVDSLDDLADDASTGLTTPFFSVTDSVGAAAITPAAANDKYEYNVTLNSTATTYTVTPTATAGTITLVDATGAEQTILTGEASTTLTAPDSTMHNVYLYVKETGKVAVKYTLHVGEAA
ncbi:MAG: hypothetical protein M0R06_00605 [Sphaerochaeta sp.]|jgi:hypothetical protein|nr:hypothetical protein [Sphaerochaeta sp.]